MTFREKIDKLLSTSKKKFTSITELEALAGLGMNTLRKAYNEDREPSNKVIVKLLEKVGINPEWWDTGIGDIYLEKPTSAIKNEQADILEHPLVKSFVRELDTLRKLVEVLERDNERLRGSKQ